MKAIVVTGARGKFAAASTSRLRARTEGKPVENMSDFNAVLNASVEAGPNPRSRRSRTSPWAAASRWRWRATRVATPKAQLGLELQLGGHPGFGGTQRLPRLVGLPKALEMMLKSKPIAAEEALKLGLVDEIAPASNLLAAAMTLARDIAEKRKPRAMASFRSDKLPRAGAEMKQIFAAARRQAKKVKSVMPHPWLCLDAVEAGVARRGRGPGGGAGGVREGGVERACRASCTFFSRRARRRRCPGSRTSASSRAPRSASASSAAG